MLSPGRGLRGASAEEMARAPEGIGWKVTASLEGVGDGHEVATWSEGAGRQVEIDGKAATQAALGGVARVLVADAGDGSAVDGGGGGAAAVSGPGGAEFDAGSWGGGDRV